MGSMTGNGHILLLNPWIYDFAAHNLWIEPVGLLTIAAALHDSGYDVTVLDCLATHPGAPRPREDGSGKLHKTVLDKPACVAHVPRRYGRYGLPLPGFDAALGIRRPDLVMCTSGMTYWYPGVVEAIARVRARFGAVPVVLGGVYATLCTDHAREHTDADRVIPGPGVVAALELADQVTGNDSEPERYTDPRTWPTPAHDLVERRYAALRTSWGCPHHCTYCASHRLQPTCVQREPSAVINEIAACVRQGIRDFAFYDDALLMNAQRHIVPILEGVLRQGTEVRFHTPNGIHAGSVDSRLATLMRRAGFATLRLSLETIDPDRQRTTGGKVTTAAFTESVARLRAAGFGAAELGAYLLVGLPGQTLSEVKATVELVHSLGVQAKLALFSPIPGTPDGDRALSQEADPLLHNSTVYPYLQGANHMRELQRIKLLAKDGNAALLRGP
jgi:radical SAM superfamily enzyme YgiQ (UPF0313 family)